MCHEGSPVIKPTAGEDYYSGIDKEYDGLTDGVTPWLSGAMAISGKK
jgi:hypothetical protein